MILFNTSSGHYEMFYVAYWHGVPGCDITSCNGSIWRAVARTAGCAGVAGPYDDVGPILLWNSLAQAWEGEQGVDSLSPPVLIGGEWLAAYGSSRKNMSATLGRTWAAGMSSAPSLAGPWLREPLGINPISNRIGASVENPIIIAIPDTVLPRVLPWRFLMMFDGIVPMEASGACGYAFSTDGLIWSEAQSLFIANASTTPWFSVVRTPQGLVPTARIGEFLLFFTAQRPGDVVPSPNGTFPYYSVGRATVELKLD
jgi:hypothetical protein